jgi:hypothetical protein
MIVVNFVEQEVNALLQLIDLAIKSGGLQVSEAGSFLAKKLREAHAASVTPPQPEVPAAAKEPAAPVTEAVAD